MTGELISPAQARNTAGAAAWAVAICISLSIGCNVGPRYAAPAPPAPAFKEAAPAAYGGAPPGSWQPAQPRDGELKGKWWEMFGEPELNALEDQLNIDNQNIAQYFQNFMAARAQVREARAGYFPTVTVNPTFSRNGTGAASAPEAASPTANGATRGMRQAEPQALRSLPCRSKSRGSRTYGAASAIRWARPGTPPRSSAADLENERLTEQAALAEYYLELRGQDTLQDVYNRTIDADRQSLELTRALVETGIDSPEAVAQAEVTLRGRGSRRHRHCHKPRHLRTCHRHAGWQARFQFFDAREKPDHGDSRDPCRRTLSTASTTAGYCRCGARHGPGECGHRN